MTLTFWVQLLPYGRDTFFKFFSTGGGLGSTHFYFLWFFKATSDRRNRRQGKAIPIFHPKKNRYLSCAQVLAACFSMNRIVVTKLPAITINGPPISFLCWMSADIYHEVQERSLPRIKERMDLHRQEGCTPVAWGPQADLRYLGAYCNRSWRKGPTDRYSGMSTSTLSGVESTTTSTTSFSLMPSAEVGTKCLRPSRWPHLRSRMTWTACRTAVSQQSASSRDYRLRWWSTWSPDSTRAAAFIVAIGRWMAYAATQSCNRNRTGNTRSASAS